MTINVSNAGNVTADYDKTCDVATKILVAIRDESIGYGALGCALALARLCYPDGALPPQTEVKLVGELIEWCGQNISLGPPVLVH